MPGPGRTTTTKIGPVAAIEPGKIRNVAVVGHRGTRKTSLVEAMLYQAQATNRLGVVEQGSTISDWDEDEQAREMSISAALCHLEWQGRKDVDLRGTPGEPSFQGDAIAALHVVEGALIGISAVMGVEGTARNWARADELGLARVLYVNMLEPRAR